MDTVIYLLVSFFLGAIMAGLLKRWDDKKSEESPQEESQKLSDSNSIALQSFLRNRMNVSDGENVRPEMPKSSDLLLCGILEELDIATLGKALKMTIKSGDKIEEITDEYQILSFDIREYVKSHPEGRTINTIMFHIQFENRDVMMTMIANSQYTEHTRYFKINAFTSISDVQYLSYNSLVEVRFTDSDQDYWEAKYMIDKAKSEIESGEYSNETLVTLSVMRPSISSNHYWGSKYFQKAVASKGDADFMYQALYFLGEADKELRKDFDRLTEDGLKALAEINMNIGQLLLINGHPEKAYVHLELGRRTNTIIGEMLYVDCLCMQSHPFAEAVIKDLMARLLQQINQTENSGDLAIFNQFLNRRLVDVYKSKKRYTDAELILNRMLVNGEDDPQYLNEILEEIRKEKEQANQENAYD